MQFGLEDISYIVYVHYTHQRPSMLHTDKSFDDRQLLHCIVDNVIIALEGWFVPSYSVRTVVLRLLIHMCETIVKRTLCTFLPQLQGSCIQLPGQVVDQSVIVVSRGIIRQTFTRTPTHELPTAALIVLAALALRKRPQG